VWAEQCHDVNGVATRFITSQLQALSCIQLPRLRLATEIQIVSPLAPSEVLDRLRARAGRWQESELPARLRDAGFYGVRIVVEGNRFSLQLEGGGRNPYFPRCQGRVLPLAGGSRVTAGIRPSRGTIVGAVLSLAFFGFVGRPSSSAPFSFFGIVLLGGMYALGYKRSAPWRDGLVEILRAAVESAGPTAGRPSSAAGAA